MKNIIKKTIFLSLLFTAVYLNLHSQYGTPLIKVIVAPDHKDWMYKAGETARFSVQVIQYGNLLENVTVDYEAGPEMLPDIKKEDVILRNGKNEFSGNYESPGILSSEGMEAKSRRTQI
jgi:hypothetical protein